MLDSDSDSNRCDDDWERAFEQLDERNHEKNRDPQFPGWVSRGAIEQDDAQKQQQREPWRKNTKWLNMQPDSAWHWSHWCSARKDSDNA